MRLAADDRQRIIMDPAAIPIKRRMMGAMCQAPEISTNQKWIVGQEVSGFIL